MLVPKRGASPTRRARATATRPRWCVGAANGVRNAKLASGFSDFFSPLSSGFSLSQPANTNWKNDVFNYEVASESSIARDYDPTVGRWVSKDATRFRGGLNFYAYANNDPINWVDRTGRAPNWVAKLVDLSERGMQVINRGLGFEEAVQAAERGEDLIARNEKLASEIAEEANERGGGMCTVERHDAHRRAAGPDARPHFHPFGKDGNNHIFYQFLPLADLNGDGSVDCTDPFELFAPWMPFFDYSRSAVPGGGA